VHFTDGTQKEFDAIIMATGFRASFPFLSKRVAGWDMATTPPLYLKMMHPTIPSLFFVGLFQPIGCIWRLADYQARVAALQLSGRLQRPADLAARIRHEIAHPHHRFDPSPRHAIESTTTPSGASSWTSLPPPRLEARGSRPCSLVRKPAVAAVRPVGEARADCACGSVWGCRPRRG
jgi:hypothetical protein